MKGKGRMATLPPLEIDTKALIEAAERHMASRKDDDQDFGAVNWGDLGVVDVEYRVSMLRPDPGRNASCMIEEASPDCKLGALCSRRPDRGWISGKRLRRVRMVGGREAF